MNKMQSSSFRQSDFNTLDDDDFRALAKNLLGFERIFLGTPRQSSNALAQVWRMIRAYGETENPLVMDRYTQFRLELADHDCLYSTIAAKLSRGEALGPEVSFLKLNQTQLFQRITEFGMELAGQDAANLEPAEGARDLHAAGQFLASRAATIYGGTSEVQKNILAKTVLGLG